MVAVTSCAGYAFGHLGHSSAWQLQCMLCSLRLDTGGGVSTALMSDVQVKVTCFGT